MRSSMLCSLTSVAYFLLNHSAAFAQAPVKSFDDTTEAPPAGAGAAKGETTTAGAEAGVATEESTPPSPAGDASVVIAERRQKAMAEYGAGKYDVALSELDKLTRDCSAASNCSSSLEATIYRDIGIVQAGGLSDSERAEASFGRALRLDPMTTIDSRFATSDVMDAFEEARENFQGEVTDAHDSPSADEAAHALILLEGTAKYGVIAVSRGTALFTDSTLQVGGAVTAAIMPGQGGMAVGARMRGGTYIGPDVGYIGGAIVLGGVFARSLKKNSAGYVMGGMGFENLPDTGRTGLTFHAIGGVLMSGLAVGGGLDINVGDPSTSQNGNHGNISVVFGLHLGFAKLL